MRDGRNISKKAKNEKKSNSNNKCFLYSYFFRTKKKYFVLKHNWKNLVYVVTFVLQLFRVAGY